MTDYCTLALKRITNMFGPPALVSLALKQPITLDSEFTGYHLLAMGAGVGIYALVRAVVVRRLNTV